MMRRPPSTARRPHGPPSTTSATGAVSDSAASSAVAGVGWPWRLALVVAIGPTRRASARTKRWSGQRMPTVCAEPPSSTRRADSLRLRTRVSGPGQWSIIHAATGRVTGAASPAAWFTSATSTASG